jgi:hypothetical protein
MDRPTVDRICVISRCKQAAFKSTSFFTLLASQHVSCRNMLGGAWVRRAVSLISFGVCP